MFVCPSCRAELRGDTCAGCGARYPIEHGIIDFSGGKYYDQFDENTPLPEEHLAGLRGEVEGAAARIDDFYLPLLKARGAKTVLDSGCGNGLSVDLLNAAGIEAWGHDLSSLRKWQWRERSRRDRLAVADATRLPFADASFDAVLSSGVLEHIGVREMGGDRYTVEPLPDRDEQRTRFLAELARVVRPGGSLFLDFPNGAFPIDFWHGTRAGGARWHSRDEGFLPAFADVVRLVDPGLDVKPVPPFGRLRFKQVGRHWYGKLFAVPMSLWLRAMGVLPWLAKSALNPYLVVEIQRVASRE